MCSLVHLTLPPQRIFDGQFLRLLRFGSFSFNVCGHLTPRPGSCAHPNRRYYTLGSPAQQTPDGCSPWEVLAYCHHLSLFGPSSHDRRHPVFQVSVPSSIWLGRRCRSCEESIQGQELRFLDNPQRFRWLEESLGQRHRFCKILLSEKLFELPSKPTFDLVTSTTIA